MDQSYLLYLSLILSTFNIFGVIYLWITFRAKKTTPRNETKTETKKPTVIKNEEHKIVEIDTNPKPSNVSPENVEIGLRPFSPKVVPNTLPKEETNSWYLEATSIPNKKFSLQVEWSDGSNDVVIEATTPVELEFYQKKGVVPIKIVGIPPHEDEGIQYLWELNGFHWS